MPFTCPAKFRNGICRGNRAECRLRRCSIDLRSLRSFTRAHRRRRSQFWRCSGTAPRLGCNLPVVDTINRAPDLRTRTIFDPCGPCESALLLIAVGGITWEAIRRFSDPGEVGGKTVMIVAAIGVVINGITALLFFAGRERDLNIRGAFLHMAADAAVSAGVVIAGLLILLTGMRWIDPVASLVINVVIVWGTWGLLRDSLAMALDVVPANVDPNAVRKYLEELNGVTAVHDLHIWPLSTTRTALTVHLEMPEAAGGDVFLQQVCERLHAEFQIEHSTIQIEQNAEACALAPDPGSLPL